MTEQIFMQAPQTMPMGTMKHDTHKAVAIMDAEDPSAYKFNHMQGSVVGTLVPVPSHNGGIKGSQNPFGKVVMGTETKIIDGRLQEVPFTPTWLGDSIKKKKGAQPMAPPAEPAPMPSKSYQFNEVPFPDLLGEDEAREEADQRVREQAAMYKQQAMDAVHRQAAAEAELSELLAAMHGQQTAPAPQPPPQMLHMQQPQVQPMSPAPQLPPSMEQFAQFREMMQMWENTKNAKLPEPKEEEDLGYDPSEVPPVKVTLRGPFGTSRSMYRFVQVTDQFVILVYDGDANIFTPPASDTPFKLSCNGEDLDVYFAGVEFELPFFGCGVQVMIRS